MDQTTSAYQELIWHIRERRQVANLDWISVYILVAIVKKRLNLKACLYQLLPILSLNMFKKIPLCQLLKDIITNQFQSDSANYLICSINVGQSDEN